MRLAGQFDYAKALGELRDRRVNYDPGEVRVPEWHIDVHRRVIGSERPGAPEPAGAWAAACALVRDYAFTPPELIRAVYHRGAPLPGRDMLLEGRFAQLRFSFGVRITEVIDERRANGDRAWGWSYQTLNGHLERGMVTYTVIKHRDSGQVEFVATCHSQPSPWLGPVLRTGWALFGRRTQLRFYRRCGERMRQLVQAALTGGQAPAEPEPLATGDLVRVPSGSTPNLLDRLALRQHHPALEKR